MQKWLIYAVVDVISVALGAHNLATGTGSLIFGTHATTVNGLPKIHYTGVAAYIGGAAFIVAGLVCIHRAWAQFKRDDE